MSFDLIITGGRRTGKTARLLEWVAAGEPIERYPGWSRVLVVHSLSEVERLKQVIRATDPPLFEDDSHRVYSLEDWRTAYATADVEVALDNLDLLVADLIGPHGRLTTASVTADNVISYVPR